MKRIGLILAAILGLAVQAVPASAAIQYTLNCSGQAANCSGANANFNFGTVTLSDNGGGSVDVTVVLASGVSFQGNGTTSLLWNTTLSGAGSAETISGLSNDFNANGLQANGSFTAGTNPSYLFSGGTNFDFSVTRKNSSGQTSLTFDVTRVGGLTLANFAEGNNDGSGAFFFAAQISSTATGSIWVASNKAGVDIPEPATWLLFVAALTGLTMFYRRRRLARA